MPARSQRRRQPIRQRVTWEEPGPRGRGVETLEDWFARGAEFCMVCGRQGLWVAVGLDGSVDEVGDDDRRVCTGCGAIHRLELTPERGEGFTFNSHWGSITRQLQLAEKAQ